MGLSTNCCIVFFARSTLIFVNLLFFALSVGVLYIGSKLRVDGWLEIVEKDHPYFDHIYQWALIGATSLIALITLVSLYCRLLTKNLVWYNKKELNALFKL
jgi:hypothetical protein